MSFSSFLASGYNQSGNQAPIITQIPAITLGLGSSPTTQVPLLTNPITLSKGTYLVTVSTKIGGLVGGSTFTQISIQIKQTLGELVQTFTIQDQLFNSVGGGVGFASGVLEQVSTASTIITATDNTTNNIQPYAIVDTNTTGTAYTINNDTTKFYITIIKLA